MRHAINASDVTYPDKADTNGYAKRYYRRKAYYFGAHNTPDSFTLFGEWKRQLIETGTPPEVKQVRRDLAHRRSQSADDSLQIRGRNGLTLSLFAFAGIACLSVLTIGGAKILSTRTPPTVDGKALSSQEIDVIRGLRQHESRAAKLAADRAERISRRVDELKEEGFRSISLNPTIPEPPDS